MPATRNQSKFSLAAGSWIAKLPSGGSIKREKIAADTDVPTIAATAPKRNAMKITTSRNGKITLARSVVVLRNRASNAAAPAHKVAPYTSCEWGKRGICQRNISMINSGRNVGETYCKSGDLDGAHFGRLLVNR